MIRNAIAFPKRSINDKNKNVQVNKEQDQLMVETIAENHQTISKKKDSEASMEESSDDSTSYPNYSFSYEVRDPNTGDDKQHEEKRDGDFVQGQYSYIEPDGSRRIVAYQSNGTEGFNAIVLKINASELVLPLEESSDSTHSDIQQEYEIPSKHKDCVEQFSNIQTENPEITQSSENQIPNESKTYMEVEALQEQHSGYKTKENNNKKLSGQAAERESEIEKDHIEFESQTMIMNYEDEIKEITESPKAYELNEESNNVQSSEIRNSNENQAYHNEVQEPQQHFAYPMAIMHTHVYPMPLLLKLIPATSNLENQTTNISKRSKKTRRHNVPNSKTRKLRVSYKLNEHENQSQIPSRKVNDIRKRGTEIKQENGGHHFETYW
ncbi:uncharacterized protein LOC129608428 [Condylostylus longicornis]|uniref:uncharacterized protein LOC129608428 n=1 Tax=Condylostylus longicornis TaxID=2530218 RepID=UPI00244E4082|nr:uncharacterized protein LOC129608428 [Condylostylus longicornis]